MLTSKLSKQLTATLAELDTVRARANEYQNKWNNAEDALRRERSRSRQVAEENSQLQDVISALRSLVADKTAVLEATRTKLEEEKRVTSALSEDHIRLMEDTYANMLQQPSTFQSTSTDSLMDTASFYTARSTTSSALHSESSTSLSDVSFYSQSPSSRSSPNQLAKPTARHQLYSIVCGRALLAVEMVRNDDAGLGFTFACQSVVNQGSPTGNAQQGVFVKAVREGSLAGQCLVPGDEILELNNMFCRGVPHPVVAMKLKGLLDEVNLVIARPLHQCGLQSAAGGPNPALPNTSQPSGGPLHAPVSMVNLNTSLQDVLHDMLQNFQVQISEEQRQVRDDIAVCNRSVISVQMAVEDALSSRQEADGMEASTPTGSVESLAMGTSAATCPSDDTLVADGNEPDAPVRPTRVSTRSRRISTISVPGSGTDRLYDELLRTKQQLSDQLIASGDTQASMVALRAECSGAVLRARQAESSAKESSNALQEAKSHSSSQQQVWDNVAQQLASVTQQLTSTSQHLSTAKEEVSAKAATISQLLQQEKHVSSRLEQLQTERDEACRELGSAKALLKEREDFLNSMQDEKQASSEWQSKARTAQEELFHMRAQLSASESQLSHWQIKEQQLQGQLSKLNERLKRTEEELVDSQGTTDRFEKQLNADRVDHQDEVKRLTEQTCTAEMENQQLELQLRQQRSGDTGKAQQLSEEIAQLEKDCQELKSATVNTQSSLRSKEEELLDLRHQLQQVEAECRRMREDREKHTASEKELRASTVTLRNEKEQLEQRVQELLADCERCHRKLEQQQETVSDTARRLDSVTESSNVSALERAQLQASLDRKAGECAELEAALLARKKELEAVQLQLEDASRSQEKSSSTASDLQVHISGLKSLQQEQGKQIEKLQQDLQRSQEECASLSAEKSAILANDVQLKASVETYRSREAAGQLELETQRATVKKLETDLQQELTRREVLEKELGRLEKSFQSISDASMSMTSSSADQRKSLEVQLKDERQQLLQSKTESAELQTRLKSTEAKVAKQRARVESLQNEAALLQQTSDMLKEACAQNDSQQRDSRKQIADLLSKVKSTQSSLEAANDAATQMRDIVTGNAEELGELRMSKSRQASDLKKLKSANAELEKRVKTLSTSSGSMEDELQRAKHELVSMETKLAGMRESAEEAAQADRTASSQRDELERRTAELEQRLGRSAKAKAELERQLESVMADSGEQLRGLMKKVDRLSAENDALEESRNMTKHSLMEQSDRISQERDTLVAQLAVVKEEASKFSKQLDVVRESSNAADLKAARLQSELERSLTIARDAEGKLAKAESAMLELKTANADINGRFEAQKSYLVDVQDEINRLQTEKKSLSLALEGNAETIQELTNAMSSLQANLQQHGTSDELNSQRVRRLEQEVTESRASFSQLTGQLKEERAYVSKLRAQNQATTDANEQLKSTMEQVARDADLSAAGQQKLQGKLTMLQKELGESRNQAELFSASQAAVKESLTVVLKEREDLLLALEKLRLSNQSSEQKASLGGIELERANASLTAAQAENDRLAEQVAKMANLQVELFDAQTSCEQLRREASKQHNTLHALRTERDKLRNLVQHHETDQLKLGPSSSATGQATAGGAKGRGKLTTSSNKKELFAAMTSAESESERLQEYVDKMLTAIIEQAPHLLEMVNRR